MITRRQLGVATLAAGAASVCALTPEQTSAASSAFAKLSASFGNSDLERAARSAYIFGLPLIETAGARKRQISRGTVNTFFHNRNRATWQTQTVTSSNIDCLMSSGWLDLTHGEATITLPKTGDRYFSLALMDMYTNNFAILGLRTTGGDGGVFRVVGPRQATSDPFAIRSPTPWVWALGRLLVDSDADLPEAHRLQDELNVSVDHPSSPLPDYATRSSSWPDFFASVQALMVQNPPYATDARMLAAMAPLFIGADGSFDPLLFSEADAAMIKAGRRQAVEDMATRSSVRQLNGWSYPGTNLGWFEQDYLYRAQVAQVGLAALTPSEATYLRALNEEDSQYFWGPGPWRISFAANNLPPVGAFWSLTLYEIADDGQSWLFENPIGRNWVSSRLPGIKEDADGSLTFNISRTDPGPAGHSNWLPAPKENPFIITLRLYWPDRSVPDGAYKPPRVMKV